MSASPDTEAAAPTTLAGRVTALFDRLERIFDGAATRRAVSALLAGGFVLALLVIDLARRGWLGERLGQALPHGHFHAVELAFYLLLSWEVAGLVFALAQSVSNAAGKQLEIFSLILLRHAFEGFASLDEPLRWWQARDVILPVVSDAVAALLLFVVLGVYYGVQRHRPLSSDSRDRADFVATKKALALLLLAALLALAARSLLGLVLQLEPRPFFEAFYTMLVFADVLLVLVSLRYSASYHVVFRNSGLAVATVLLRLALEAPPPWSGLLGLGAALFALGLTLAYNRFAPVLAAGRTEAAP